MLNYQADRRGRPEDRGGGGGWKNMDPQLVDLKFYRVLSYLCKFQVLNFNFHFNWFGFSGFWLKMRQQIMYKFVCDEVETKRSTIKACQVYDVAIKKRSELSEIWQKNKTKPLLQQILTLSKRTATLK